MKLKTLSVGPIVGEATGNRVRVWGRGNADIIDGMPRRSFGVVRYRKKDDSKWINHKSFKMNPNFDMTGIAVIEKLKSETYYEYQFGYFYSDAELDERSFGALDWKNISISTFLTASTNDKKSRTIIIGSCRYLLKTWLGSFFDDRGDKTFRSILKQIDNGIEIHQIIMMGDQIYADDLNSYNPDKTLNQFNKRYQDAFSQKYIRKLMSQVSTYMTLDDHEIEDNWPANASEKDWKTVYPNAIHAYQTYQLSHSPNIPVVNGRLSGTPNHLWYKYTDGCCDIFVTDSRTERHISNDDTAEMLSPTQMKALKTWLSDGTKRVKMIVTSVPFAPDSATGETNDKWGGFEAQRIELLEHIDSNSLKKVVFLSGDVHASFSLELLSKSGTKIISIVSSSFFWPYPHPSARHFKRSGVINGGKAGDFKIISSKNIVSDDNFTRLSVSPDQVLVEVFLRKGKRKIKKIHKF